MFVYKTDAQLEAMSAAERDDYATAKRAYGAKLAKEAVEEAVKTAKEEMEKSFETKSEDLKKQIDSAVKANSNLEEIVKTQGIELAKRSSSNAGVDANELKEELKTLHKRSQDGLVGEKVMLKAFTGDAAISVSDIPNVAGNGTIAGAIGNIANFFAQLLPGIFKKPVPKSNIVDYCDVVPLTANKLVAISETSTVSILVTAEGVTKPNSKAVWTEIDETAKPIATIWKSTDQMRMFFLSFVNSFYKTILLFFDKKVPEVVIAKINSNATAFTPVPSQVIYPASSVNNFDAIVQMIASLVNLGYVPNVAKISNYAYSALKTLKGTDGHYMLANNGSINLLKGTISFGDIEVKLDTDPSFGNDDVMVGDLNAVKVAIDNNISYVEAYVGTDLEDNKKSHRLEKYIAVVVPEALRSGIIKDTLTNVKTLITKA